MACFAAKSKILIQAVVLAATAPFPEGCFAFALLHEIPGASAHHFSGRIAKQFSHPLIHECSSHLGVYCPNAFAGHFHNLPVSFRCGTRIVPIWTVGRRTVREENAKPVLQRMTGT